MSWSIREAKPFRPARQETDWRERRTNPEGRTSAVVTAGTFSSFQESHYQLVLRALETVKQIDQNCARALDRLAGKTAFVKVNFTQTPGTDRAKSAINELNSGIWTNVYAVQAVVDFLIALDVQEILIGEACPWPPGYTKQAYDECGYTSLFQESPYINRVSLLDTATATRRKGRILSDRAQERVTVSLRNTPYADIIEKRIRSMIAVSQLPEENLIKKSLEFSFNKVLERVDLLVNLAKLKTHAQAYVTGAVKNLYGLLEPPFERWYSHLNVEPLTQDSQRDKLCYSYDYLNTRIAANASAVRLLRLRRAVPELDLIEAGWWAIEGAGPGWQGKHRRESVVAATFDSAASLDQVALELMFNEDKNGYDERFANIARLFLRKKNISEQSEVGQAILREHKSVGQMQEFSNKLGLGTVDSSQINITLLHKDRQPSNLRDMRTGGPFEHPRTVAEATCVTSHAYGPLFKERPELKRDVIVVVEEKSRWKEILGIA